MRYIIELNPNCVDGEFLRMPIIVAGEEQWIKTKVLLTPYTETDSEAIEDELHRGDEVKDKNDIKAVILERIEESNVYEVMTEYGDTEKWNKDIMAKTGRHFIELYEMLEKMKE